MNNPIIEALFSTNAIRVCDPEQPFWYTSGTLGPFYINTHFLYRSEQDASNLLLLIEESAAADRIAFPQFILGDLVKMYETCEIFRMVTDRIVNEAEKIDFDFISGGERRDFFFSILPAYLMHKPHLCIFKDLQAVYTSADFAETIPIYEAKLAGKKALHIADLVTEASSYLRAWIPVIREFGADMQETIAIINRKQGGEEALLNEGIRLHSFVSVGSELFDEARSTGKITNKQYELVMDFMSAPKEFMHNFLHLHPQFISEQLALGGKAKERAEMAISKGYANHPDGRTK